MTELVIRTEKYFDGAVYHSGGPYRVIIKDGVIRSVTADNGAASDLVTPFLMPGLVEAHCHIFLDGGELDFQKRNAYFKADFPAMREVALANLDRSRAAGITVIRDAGDRYGVNHAMRVALSSDPLALAQLRSPGLGVRRPKRYGAFMAREVVEASDLPAIIGEMAATADDVKIILTGIIDFEAGGVKGEPQFNAEELAVIVAAAHQQNRKTFAHCSGLDGLEVAVAAGVDSIEHGFFMTEDILKQMADKGIAWVPTFSPVHFQWARPELVPWNAQTVVNLRKILDSHAEHVALAFKHGVPLVAGSDAGSQGVVHGTALIDELFHFLDAGLPMAEVLISATSRPRHLWGMASADVAVGNQADLVLLNGSPFENAEALRGATKVVRGMAVG